jgi:CRISP-associated protein Cas1
MRDEGLGWVVRADVEDCFPSVDAAHAGRVLVALVDDEGIRALILKLLARGVARRGGARRMSGLPQGSPLSPMLANLVLDGLDERVRLAGFPMARYADDFVVGASSRDEAWEAMRVASDAAAALGLSLGADKSAVMSFDEGFCFLGEDFGPRYPPVLDEHRVDVPDHKVVYVGLQGSRVRVNAGRLLVESPDDQEVLDVPCGHVGRVVCFGSVGVSAGARSWALAGDVDLVFVSRRGSYLGQATARNSRTRVWRLRRQLAAGDDPGRIVEFGRAVVTAKVRKQLVLLQRFGRRHNAEHIAQATGELRHLLVMVPSCASRDELMGLEGAAARRYFAALGQIVPPELAFTGRSRQPPLDIVNSALSYGYAILLGEAESALRAAGLDPAIGLLHTEQEARPSLALDLMEEFRPLVVDQAVISAATARRLRPEDAQREDGVPGVLLTRAGRAAVVDGYETRMLQRTSGALPDFSGSLRRHLYRQAERIAGYLCADAGVWTGLSWR